MATFSTLLLLINQSYVGLLRVRPRAFETAQYLLSHHNLRRQNQARKGASPRNLGIRAVNCIINGDTRQSIIHYNESPLGL